ncbi:synaptogyrin-1 isoform X2 [Erythrolamprus reginae]|uniref:synaptogyrin-1 isoform X2 n=1 Tax=Erythrolamprus reginae TaxID=121349 RepID=UPI00396CB6C9
METAAYGAGKAGGAFDPQTFIRQPHTVLRIVSWGSIQAKPRRECLAPHLSQSDATSCFPLRQRFHTEPTIYKDTTVMLFSIVVFGCIVNEGYINQPDTSEQFCIYNRNQNACNYGITVGVLTFLTCLLYLALDVYFPQISSVKDRKKAVLSDIGVSGFWAFLWFVGFCFLADQWRVSKKEDIPLNEGSDAARAAIAFSFFSIFTWSFLTFLAFRRLGEITFQEEYNTLFPNSSPVLP